jgi:hypothetical protein
MDTLSVITRRILTKHSPFSANCDHLHHLLIDAGFRVRHAVYLIAFMQLLIGVTGLTAYYLNTPEPIMFISYCAFLFSYIFLVGRPWRAVPMLRAMHRAADLTVRGVHHVYVGKLHYRHAMADIELLLGDCKEKQDYCIYKTIEQTTGKSYVFAVIDVKDTDNVKKIIKHLNNMRRHLLKKRYIWSRDILIKQYISRSTINDRRKTVDDNKKKCNKRNERRCYSIEMMFNSYNMDKVL